MSYFNIVQRIKVSTDIPLTVKLDKLERGYTDNVNELIDNIERLIDAGVVGINLEKATYGQLDQFAKSVKANQSFESLFY